MRLLAIFAAAVILTGCDYGFTFHPEGTPDQMFAKADLVFIGLVQEVHPDSWPFFRLTNISSDNYPERWKPIRVTVRIETVLRGQYSGQYIDVYEIVRLGGVSINGDSSEGRRYVFFAHKEHGRWRTVRDGPFSIFPVKTGPHARLPLDDSRTFAERFVLLNYWVAAGETGSFQMFGPMSNMNNTLGSWREAKLLRGLLHHPQHKVHLAACWELNLYSGQDECSQGVSESDWNELAKSGFNVAFVVKGKPPVGNHAREQFDRLVRGLTGTSADRDTIDGIRMFTTINDRTLRREFCQKFLAKFPHDTDNGCPADKPLPATIVTENGDVPLIGPWPN